MIPMRNGPLAYVSVPLLLEPLNLLADWCERGVRGVAVTQQIDLSGKVGPMVASALFGLTEIGDRRGDEAGRVSRPRTRCDQGIPASCLGTSWPRSHCAGNRHSLGHRSADRVLPGHGTDVVIS